MAPTVHDLMARSQADDTGRPQNPDGLVLEAWAQGYMVGSLIIMAAVTIANMRKGVILHKLILLELILGMFHGTFIFTHRPVYGWYLSCTAIPLNISWSLHNVISWLKNRPFLSRRASMIYIGTVILAQPYWVVEIYANFMYFNGFNTVFLKTRPVEALFRDPWWIFSTASLFSNIKVRYGLAFVAFIPLSPRFGVLLGAMLLSICFIIVDIVATTGVFNSHALPDGINPFWKLAFIFKCLTDTIVLDDFKTALDLLTEAKLRRLDSFAGTGYCDRRSLPSASSSRPKSDPPIRHVERDDTSLESGHELSLQDALRMSTCDAHESFAKFDSSKAVIIAAHERSGTASCENGSRTSSEELQQQQQQRLHAAAARARLEATKREMQGWWS